MIRHLFILFLLMAVVEASGQAAHYTIVFLNKKSDAEKLSKEQSDKIMEGHFANMKKLATEGKLLAAGPFEGGGGIFVMNTTKRDDVEKWIADDAGIKAKRWNVEILPYNPRFGGVCPVGEVYEMTQYSFVRFDAIVSKFTAQDYPEIMKRHDEYLNRLTRTGNVITEAVFGDNDGGILILKGDVQQEVMENDPAVKEGLVEMQFKKLYIAKGSFCEAKN